MGVAVLGDSAGAHFEVPENWVNVTEWNNTTFSNLIYRAADELDLP
jgi:acyloxyacyl hydrolase